jgi:hypothetical protein
MLRIAVASGRAVQSGLACVDCVGDDLAKHLLILDKVGVDPVRVLH